MVMNYIDWLAAAEEEDFQRLFLMMLVVGTSSKCNLIQEYFEKSRKKV